MKRIAVLMLVAGLAACSGSKDTPEGNAEESATVQGDEVAGESPSDITSIDAATGFAGGMSADTPESALPKPQETRPRPTRESSTVDEDEPIAPEPIVNLTPPAPSVAPNATAPAQPPQ